MSLGWRIALGRLPVVRQLSSLRVTVACFSLLFILVLWGTLHQVRFGLYDAQQRFFYAWGFLAGGFLPIPGGRLVLWVLFVNLALGAMIRLRYRWNQLGIVLIHAGILAFFPAAFVSFHYSHHSVLQLREGQSANVSAAYHDWELSIWTGERDAQGTLVREVTAIAAPAMRPGRSFSLSVPAVRVAIDAYHGHCNPLRAEGAKPGWLSAGGWGGLQPLPLEREPERNAPGVRFTVEVGGERHDLLLHAVDTAPVVLSIDGVPWRFALRRQRRPLPYAVGLVDFERVVHTGTSIPRSFRSVVEVGPPDARRQVIVSMNKPLRHETYTFYQHSFTEDELGSVFAVVDSPGRWLPYIASALTGLGLLAHFFVQWGDAARRRRAA